jgi:hypothetical protein
LNEGRYDAVSPTEEGIIRSRVSPGLHFHSELFWADDLAGLLKVLQAGIATQEHATFIESIQPSQ